MRVRHPAAHPPAAVDVNGATVPVDGETFELPDGAGRSWVQTFASAHGVAPEDILVEELPEPDDLTVDESDEETIQSTEDLEDAAEGTEGAAATDEGVTLEEVEAIGDEVIAERIDAGECPWCSEYSGENVGMHASRAHPDAWNDYTGD